MSSGCKKTTGFWRTARRWASVASASRQHGLTSATVGLAFRADEALEALHSEPFSSLPELLDVMKPQESGSSANDQAQ